MHIKFLWVNLKERDGSFVNDNVLSDGSLKMKGFCAGTNTGGAEPGE